MHCNVLYCYVLQCSAVQCSAVQYCAVHCTAVYCTAVYCPVLYLTVLHFNVPPCTILYPPMFHLITTLHCYTPVITRLHPQQKARSDEDPPYPQSGTSRLTPIWHHLAPSGAWNWGTARAALHAALFMAMHKAL